MEVLGSSDPRIQYGGTKRSEFTSNEHVMYHDILMTRAAQNVQRYTHPIYPLHLRLVWVSDTERNTDYDGSHPYFEKGRLGQVSIKIRVPLDMEPFLYEVYLNQATGLSIKFQGGCTFELPAESLLPLQPTVVTLRLRAVPRNEGPPPYAPPQAEPQPPNRLPPREDW